MDAAHHNLSRYNLADLGTHEKLQLVEDLWDSIEQEQVPVMTGELHAELQRRSAWVDAHPGTGVSFETLCAELGVRL